MCKLVWGGGCGGPGRGGRRQVLLAVGRVKHEKKRKMTDFYDWPSRAWSEGPTQARNIQDVFKAHH